MDHFLLKMPPTQTWASLYERIVGEVGESYSLGYTPTTTVEGGKYRRIKFGSLRVTKNRGCFSKT
jgi:hypothetical protein